MGKKPENIETVRIFPAFFPRQIFFWEIQNFLGVNTPTITPVTKTGTLGEKIIPEGHYLGNNFHIPPTNPRGNVGVASGAEKSIAPISQNPMATQRPLITCRDPCSRGGGDASGAHLLQAKVRLTHMCTHTKSRAYQRTRACSSGSLILPLHRVCAHVKGSKV